MRVTLKRAAGPRSKTETKRKSTIDEEAIKNGSDKDEENRNAGLCPFLLSCADASERLLLISEETSNDQRCRPASRHPSTSLNSDLTPCLLQPKSPLDRQMSPSNQEAAAVSISPWSTCDYPDEVRWSGANRTCLSSNAWHQQQRASPEVVTSRTQCSSSRSLKTSDKRRWESLWRDSRPPDIKYRFQHYSDINRYMEQYRQDHVHRRISPKNRKEELLRTHSVIPPFHCDPAPVERSFNDPTRLCLTQRAFRFSYNRQTTTTATTTTDPDQQRSRREASLGRRGQLDQLESITVYSITDGKDRAVGGERCNSGQTLNFNGSNGVTNCVMNNVITRISLPTSNLRVDNRRNNTPLTEFLTNRKKIIATPNSKGTSPRLVVPPAAKNHSSIFPSSIRAVLTEINVVQDRTSVDADRSQSNGDHQRPSLSSAAVIPTSECSTSATNRMRQLKRFPRTTFVAISDLDIHPSSSSSSSSSSATDVDLVSASKSNRPTENTRELLLARIEQRISPDVYSLQPKLSNTICHSSALRNMKTESP